MTTRAEARLRRIVTYVLLIGGLGFALIPIWYMVATSFKPQTLIFEMPPRLLPEQWTLDNYTRAVTNDNFGRYFLNSAAVAIATTAVTVFVASMLAFAFARLQFPGREKLFYLLLLGMMVPPVMLIIPQFLIGKALGVLNSLPGLVLVYVTMNISMQTFLLRGVFEGVPRDLEEAALIDGGSQWTIFWRVILPLSGPGLAVVIINSFLYSWEEFAWAQVSIKELSLRTLPVGIALFQSEHLTEWGQVFAASLIAMLPVVLIFLIFQRRFVQGIATTGLKG